jgi:hypothetical protein
VGDATILEPLRGLINELLTRLVLAACLAVLVA